jgi:hypothetical protein
MRVRTTTAIFNDCLRYDRFPIPKQVTCPSSRLRRLRRQHDWGLLGSERLETRAESKTQASLWPDTSFVPGQSFKNDSSMLSARK